MIYYLHNNIKIEHFTSRWCVAAVVWQATRAYSWGWDTVIFRWKFESELVMTVFVISGVLWGRIFPQKKLFFFIYLTISTRKMHIPGLRIFSPHLHFSRCHLGMLHFDPYQSSEVPFFWWTIKIMYLKFTSNRAPRPPKWSPSEDMDMDMDMDSNETSPGGKAQNKDMGNKLRTL